MKINSEKIAKLLTSPVREDHIIAGLILQKNCSYEEIVQFFRDLLQKEKEKDCFVKEYIWNMFGIENLFRVYYDNRFAFKISDDIYLYFGISDIWIGKLNSRIFNSSIKMIVYDKED